jgi:hypothetical protein
LRGVFGNLEGYSMRKPTEKLAAILLTDNFLGDMSHGNIILSSLKSWFMRASSFVVADR